MNSPVQPLATGAAAIDPASAITQPLAVPAVAAKGDDDLMSAPQTAAPLADIAPVELATAAGSSRSAPPR